MSHMHKCPVNGCEIDVPRAQLMCRTHWFMVPGPLRKAVWDSYRKRQWGDWRKNAIEAERFVNERVTG